MLGLGRRKKVEGWAINISKSDGDSERQGVIQRIADNNRAWIACLAGVVLLTFFLVKYSNRTIGGSAPLRVPQPAPSEFRDRSRYTRFEQEFRGDKQFAELVLVARFLSPGRFQIVVPGGISADEIGYMAGIAAERISYRLRHRTVVQLYQKSMKGDTRILVATAQWQPKKRGYTVRFHIASQGSR